MESCETAGSLHRLDEHRDIGVSAFVMLSWALWHRGYPDQSARAADRALAYSRELGNAHTVDRDFRDNHGSALGDNPARLLAAPRWRWSTAPSRSTPVSRAVGTSAGSSDWRRASPTLRLSMSRTRCD